MTRAMIRVGHVVDVVDGMEAESVHCVVTSPPYWGLRDYGLPPQVWPARHGMTCPLLGAEHRWAEVDQWSAVCAKCEAWRGSLGLEPDPDTYVDHLVRVFDAVARALRRDGTLWLNIGDSYTSGRRTYRAPDKKYRAPDSLVSVDGGGRGREMGTRPVTPPGMKEKDLVGVPWMVAAALRKAGWYLRSEIVWAKPNPCPESVRDRPTRSHEKVFLLARRPEYYYDRDAVLEPSATPGAPGRNRRDVWTVGSKPFRGAHFATFPPDLVEPCILAGTSAGGCCAACGSPLRRRLAGWERACRCGDGPTRPCLVMDPFAGAATVGVVAHKTGRDFVGVELGRRFVEMGVRRLSALGVEVAVM